MPTRHEGEIMAEPVAELTFLTNSQTSLDRDWHSSSLPYRISLHLATSAGKRIPDAALLMSLV